MALGDLPFLLVSDESIGATVAQLPSGDTHLFVKESHDEFPRQVIDPHADGYDR